MRLLRPGTGRVDVRFDPHHSAYNSPCSTSNFPTFFNEQMADVLAPLFKVAQQGPQALAERLSALWPEMSDDKLQERLAQAIFVAELWGEANG